VVIMKILTILLICLPLALLAVQVDVSVNKYTLATDDQLELTLKVSDSARMNISEPAPPSIPLFSFRNVTSSSASSMILNGARLNSEFSQTYRFIYFPQKEGSSAVPSFEVKVNNRVYRTREIALKVVKGQHKPPAQSGPAVPGFDPFAFDEPDFWDTPENYSTDVRLLVLPESQTVYRGFPAIVSYYLYSESVVRSFNLDAENDFSGYGKSTYEQPSMLNYEDVRFTGKPYKRALIKRLAIMPNAEGKLQVPQLEGVARMFSYGYSNQNLVSQAGYLNVLPLPKDDVPQGFTGAVGNFKLSQSLSKHEIGLGEALTFTLKIQGRGNFNQFAAPVFNSGQGFQVSPPMVVDNLTAGIEGTRTYYYTLVPQNKGEYRLPDLKFVWFGNDAGKYQVYHSPQEMIKVTSTPVLSYLNRMWEPHNRWTIYPKVSKRSYPPYIPIARQPWYWILVALVLTGTAGVSVYALEQKLKNLAPEKYARKKADSILQHYMKQAFAAAKGLSPEFYPLAEKALFDYLAAKFSLPKHLSTTEKMEALRLLEVPSELVESLNRFLSSCSAARFRPESDRATDINNDLELIKQIIAGFAKLGKTDFSGGDRA